MAKPGRPERNKASYKAEINKLKKKNADLVASTDMLYTIIDQDTERFRKYLFPTVGQRIKYLFKGEL